ncbi:MAG TPA: hypothetical protein VHS59_10565, partial [Bacillota bacterium]|nr:hypothetical protein [Bacillota bacterium]
TAKANILEQSNPGGAPVYIGSGVSLVNSPAQWFVAWGEGILVNGLLPTFNIDNGASGLQWYVDEDQAEARFEELCNLFEAGQL